MSKGRVAEPCTASGVPVTPTKRWDIGVSGTSGAPHLFHHCRDNNVTAAPVSRRNEQS